MKYEIAKKEAMCLNIAIDKIKQNNSDSFYWYPVKNKAGSIIEVGGRNKDRLEIKVYVPEYNSGKIKIYENGFIEHAYSLSTNGQIDFPNFYDFHDMEQEEFLKFINETNFKKYKPKIEIVEEKIINQHFRVKLN